MAHLARRMFTSTPFLICMLLGWGLVLAVGVAVYALRERPDLLREQVQQAVATQLPGYALSMGRLSPALWPSPGVAVEDLVLRSPDGSAVLADTASVHFRWSALLTGSIVPDRVRLESAYALLRGPDAAMPNETASAGAAQKEAASDDRVAQPQAAPVAQPNAQPRPTGHLVLAALAGLNGLTVELHDTALDIRVGGKKFVVAGLSGELQAPAGEAAGMLGVEPGRCVLHWQTMSTEGLGPRLELTGGSLQLDDLRLSPATPWLVRTGSLSVAARGAMGAYLRNADLTLTAGLALTAGPPDIRGELGLTGTAHINAIPVAVDAKIPFGSRDVRQNVDIRDARLTMEDNSLSLTATWLPDDNSLTGKVDVARLSLPRWFAFGRDLPGGLVAALDDINGSFTFRMNARGLNAPDLRLHLRGIPFTGSGGVPDFSRPEIRIEASTSRADINKIFPELTETAVKEPKFSQPPLLGGGERLPDDPPDVGFDIRLKSDEAVFWKFEGRDFQLRLSPVWEKEQVSVGGVRLDAALGDFYGGRAQGVFRTRGGLSLGLGLTGVNGERLSAAAARDRTGKQRAAPFGGRLDARADLRGDGNSLAALLAGLNGSLNATLNGGFFGTGAERRPFTRFAWRADDLSGTAAATLRTLPATLPYTARWQMEFVGPETATRPNVSVVAEGRGRFDFATDVWLPVSGRDLLFRASGNVDRLAFNLGGKAAGDRTEMRFTGLTGRAGGADVALELTGSRLNTPAPLWQASGSAATSNLRQSLSELGVDLPSTPENALRRLHVQGKLTLADTTLRLENLSGQLDATEFSGAIAREPGKGESRKLQRWTADLQLGTLDLDRYRDKDEKPDPSPQNWDLAFLRNNELTGTIQARKLIIMDMPMTNCRLPLKLSDGVFTLDPFVADAADGSAFTRFRAEATPQGLRTRLQAELKGVNMLTLRREKPEDAASRTRLAGKGTFVLDLSGLLRSGADLPGGLNGTWSARIDNGYMESGNSRRFFRAVSASGPMRSGVLDSRDMFVNGHNFMVRGQGSVDLVRNTINYQLNASLPGVPNVPITYTGPLDNPQRNINALSALGGVLANVGQGVFSILDNVISAPFRLIR